MLLGDHWHLKACTLPEKCNSYIPYGAHVYPVLQIQLLGRSEGPGEETKPVVLSAAQMGGS